MITRDQFRTQFIPVDDPKGTEVVTQLRLQVSSFISDVQLNTSRIPEGLGHYEKRHIDSCMRMIYGDVQRAIEECRRNVLNRVGFIPGANVTGIIEDFAKLRAMFAVNQPIDPITARVEDMKAQADMLNAGIHPSQRPLTK